ncbi:hypothetical protein [Demequina sp. NBRC 110054]|uniref:hypothetical protein n=1 Tax=Demequina sp. NBRC 110054 TaxID=1570343 RepID=UPI0009FBC57E|nr:hypothetical protein [Demequina sp. NBRC 110054]
MTDSGAPLSRRERRLRAEQAAAAEFDDLATSQTAAIGKDGRPLTRKERRALERTQHPMETWTAEEEMLATGQLPAMTPEVVAEQERQARERAEQAALEAEVTSEELRRVSAGQDGHGEPPTQEPPAEEYPAQAPVADAIAEPAAEPVEAVAPVEAAAPVVESAADDAEEPSGEAFDEAPAEEPGDTAVQWPTAEAVAPAAAQFAWPSSEPSPSVQETAPSQSEEPGTGAPVVEDYAGIMSPSSGEDAEEAGRLPFTGLTRRRAADQPGEASTPDEPRSAQTPGEQDLLQPAAEEPATQQTAPDVEAQPVESAEEPAASEEPPASGLPASLLSLFPPGSPQAKMMEEGAAHARAQAAAPMQRTPLPPLTPAAGQASSEPTPAQVAVAEPVADEAAEPVESPAAEQPATRGTLTPEAAALEEALQAAAPPEETATAEAEAPAAEGSAPAGIWTATAAIDPETVDHAARAAGAAVADRLGEPAPHERELPAEVFGDPAARTITPAAAPHALTAQHGDDAPTQAFPPVTAFGTSPTRGHGEAPSVWDTHPLLGGPTDFDPDEQTAVGALPMPDLAALEEAARPATQSATQGEASEPIVAGPVTDGIEVPRREVPQLEPTHGARDMHWAHFLVIGAVAFVLGLLVYQLVVRGA